MLNTTTNAATTAPPRPTEIFAATAAKIESLRMEAVRMRSVGGLKALDKAAVALKGLETGNYVSPVSARKAVEKEVRRHLLLAGDLLRRAAEADKATDARRMAAPSETDEWVAGILGRPLPKKKAA